MKVNLPVHKGEVLDVTIMDLTYQGMGVAKVDNYPIFIENALPEEKLRSRSRRRRRTLRLVMWKRLTK